MNMYKGRRFNYNLESGDGRWSKSRFQFIVAQTYNGVSNPPFLILKDHYANANVSLTN